MKTQAQTESAAYHSPWPRRLIILFIILLPFGFLLQAYIHFQVAGNSELQHAMDEAERTDSVWQIDDIESRRRVLPEAENSALVVRAITGVEQPGTGLLPDKWPDLKLDKALEVLTPEAQLNDVQIQRLREELAKAGVALTEARRLADMPYGRYPITYSKDGFSTLLPHTQANRRCINLLSYDVKILTHDRKFDDATRSCIASLNTSRAIGDEPTIVSMLVRTAGQSVTCSNIERLLAQGSPSEPALKKLQDAFERDVEEPLLLYGARGERALTDRCMAAIQNGEISMADAMRFASVDTKITGNDTVDNLLARIWFAYKVGSMKENRAAVLRFNTRFVEIAKMPIEDQQPELEALENTFRDQPFFARVFVPATAKFAEVGRRGQAMMRCAVVALAAERYRLKHGRWPNALSDLTPAFMNDVPRDPYGKGPLKLLKKPDGIIIYSVARNGIDDGGNLDRKNGGFEKNSDLGFQLWDVAKRRQPPLPVKTNVREDDE